MTAWSSSTTYASGVAVTYSGFAYISLAGSNLNNEPDTSPTWWEQAITVSKLTGYSVLLPQLQVSKLEAYGVLLPQLQVSKVVAYAVLLSGSNRPRVFRASSP